MTPSEWAIAVSEQGDEERAVTLLAMADESWLSESWAGWLRSRAYTLYPNRGLSTPKYYWCAYGKADRDYLPGVLMTAIGRVDSDDNLDKNGRFTPYATKVGVWEQLFFALEKLSR